MKTLYSLLTLFFSFSAIGEDLAFAPYPFTPLEKRIPLTQEILYGLFEGKTDKVYMNFRQEKVFSIYVRALGSVGDRLSETLKKNQEVQIFIPEIKRDIELGDLFDDYETVFFLRSYKGKLWMNNFERDHLLVEEELEGQQDLLRMVGDSYIKIPQMSFSKLNDLISKSFSGNLNTLGGNKTEKIPSTLRKELDIRRSKKQLNRGPASIENSNKEVNSSLASTFYLIIILSVLVYFIFRFKVKMRMKK